MSIIVSAEDYAAGNYPKDTPIMVSASVNAQGRGGMKVAEPEEPLKIVIRMQAA